MGRVDVSEASPKHLYRQSLSQVHLQASGWGLDISEGHTHRTYYTTPTLKKSTPKKPHSSAVFRVICYIVRSSVSDTSIMGDDAPSIGWLGITFKHPKKGGWWKTWEMWYLYNPWYNHAMTIFRGIKWEAGYITMPFIKTLATRVL